MNGLDQIRTAHRRAQTAQVLEQALRDLCDILLGDDLHGEALYDAIEQQVSTACDALDTFEHPPGVRMPPPETPTEDNTRLCAFTGEPVGGCSCTTCTARRDGGAAQTTSSEVENLEDPPASDMGVSVCPHTGKAGSSCTCDTHTAWRASGDAGTQTCHTCKHDVPVADYPRNGRGWSRDCRSCVTDRASRIRRTRDRERSDSKEPA